MKNYLLIAGAILLAFSLSVAIVAFATPAENTVKKSVKVLEYQQAGSFDIVVTAKPAYFYDNSPTAAPETSPQIPVKFIESFTLNYTYSSRTGSSAESIEINAILESPGAWKKTFNLTPEKAAASNISIPLDLKYFQDQSDAIEKEIGLSASSHDLTIQTVVSSGNGPDFVQLLPIKIGRTYIKIGDNLSSSSIGREGKFDFTVKLTDNLLFGPITLTSPSPANTLGTVLGPRDTIFTKFIDSMKIKYGYHLAANKPLRDIQEEVIVEAVLENPDKWSKTYTLVPPTRQNGDVTLSFPFDLKQFAAVFDTIQQETGIIVSAQNLTLKATLRTTAESDQGPINKTFTQSIKTNLRDGILTWSGDLKKNETGSIDSTLSVREAVEMLGLPVFWLRIISIIVALIMLVLLGIHLLPYIRRGQREPPQTQIRAKQLGRKYKEIIVEVKEWPDLNSEQTVLPLESLQDIIKVAQGLLKPVQHKADINKEVFWVYDGSNRYDYLVIHGTNEAAAADRPAETKNNTKTSY